MTKTTNPLDFLSNSTQYSYDRLTCQETTVRVLLAILFQANMADTEESSDWQTMKHLDICPHVSQILEIMGMTHILDKVCTNGEVQFSTPEKPWVTPAQELESLQGHLREAQFAFDHWLESTDLDEESEEYQDLYWDHDSSVDDLKRQVGEILATL